MCPAAPQPTVKTAGLTRNLGGTTQPAAPAPTTTPMPSAPTSGLSHGGTSMPGAPSLTAPSSGMPTAPTSGLGTPSMAGGAPQPTTPGELMHSFDKGLQAGTPLPGAGAVPPPQVAPTDPQLAQATTPSAGAGVPATAQAFESPAPITTCVRPRRDCGPTNDGRTGDLSRAGRTRTVWLTSRVRLRHSARGPRGHHACCAAEPAAIDDAGLRTGSPLGRTRQRQHSCDGAPGTPAATTVVAVGPGDRIRRRHCNGRCCGSGIC